MTNLGKKITKRLDQMDEDRARKNMVGMLHPQPSQAPMSQPTKRKRGFFWKVKLYFYGITTILMITTLVIQYFIFVEFVNTHTFKWQSPIVLQSPLLIDRNSLLSPQAVFSNSLNEATESAQPAKRSFIPTNIIPSAYAHEEEAEKIALLNDTDNAGIVWRIYQLESSFGKEDGCKKKGLYNGFGYAQPDSAMAKGTGACYKSFDEVVNLVDTWFTRQLKEMDIETALCYYNTGHKINDCGYLNKYLATL